MQTTPSMNWGKETSLRPCTPRNERNFPRIRSLLHMAPTSQNDQPQRIKRKLLAQTVRRFLLHLLPDATSFSTCGHRCMKQLSTSRTLCVFRHGPSLLALSPNKFLLLVSSGTLFTIFFRTSQLPGASCYLLCSAASPQHTSMSLLRSIQFA
jgi:hypothetical protein